MVVQNTAMAAQYKLAHVASASPSNATAAWTASKQHSRVGDNGAKCVPVGGMSHGRGDGTTWPDGSHAGGPGSWEREQGWIVEMIGRIGQRLQFFRDMMFLSRCRLGCRWSHRRAALSISGPPWTGQGTPHWECLLAESVICRLDRT